MMLAKVFSSIFAQRISSKINGAISRHCSNSSFNGVTKIVDPFSTIKITSQCHLNIRPYNVYDCPDGNLLRVSLDNSDIRPSIDVDGASVTIDTKVPAAEHLDSTECLIEVPVAANLLVNGKRNISIEQSLCDTIDVTSQTGNITTSAIRTKSLALRADDGHVECKGMTLAQQIDIRTIGNKNIRLDKIQSIALTATTEHGSISTDACYAEDSKFTTKTGKLQLRNVHKNCEINLMDGGELLLTGFHGTLNVEANASVINVQLDEIAGSNHIAANAPKSLIVKISDLIETESLIVVDVDDVKLDETLNRLTPKIVNKGQLTIGNSDSATNATFAISSDGQLTLGKSSWMDSFTVRSR